MITKPLMRKDPAHVDGGQQMDTPFMVTSSSW
jgi:hypothetical protein